MLTPRSVEHIAASWHSKTAALSNELQHPFLVSGGDRVAGGVWCGEVHVVIRVRHHGIDVQLDLVEQGSMAVADARRCSNHCTSIAGSSSTPRGTPRATNRRRIKSRSRPVATHSLRKRPSSAIFFALIRRREDDEKTTSKVRQENQW